MGRAAAGTGHPEEGIRHLQAVLQRTDDPTLRGRCYATMAACRTRLGQLEQALDDYDRAFALLPLTKVHPLLKRAQLHQQLGHREQAEADARAAIERLDIQARRGPEQFHQRFMAHEILGDTAAVLENFVAFVRVEKNAERLHVWDHQMVRHIEQLELELSDGTRNGDGS